MGEWLVLLYFSVQMLHVVMGWLVCFVGLFLYDFDCVFGVRGWVVGGCGVVVGGVCSVWVVDIFESSFKKLIVFFV